MSERVLNSVWGVLRVLQEFAYNQETWGPRELAKTLGLSRGTTLRILQTLVDENFLINSENAGQYIIGPELWRLGLGLRSRVNLSSMAAAVLRKHVQEINESMHFFTHRAGVVIFEQIVECTHEVRYHLDPGIPYVIEKGAAGKVILAFLPVGEAQEIIEKLEQDVTVNTDELLKKVAQTKYDGYSFTNNERGSGVVGFAAPILGPSKAFLGGIGLAIPMMRYRPEDHGRYADLVRACAGEISFLAHPNTDSVEKERRKTG